MASDKGDNSVGEDVGKSLPSTSTDSGISLISMFINSVLESPFNFALLLVILYLFYRLIRGSSRGSDDSQSKLKIPPLLEPHDMDLNELHKYDGKGIDGRVCIAINNKVFDCSSSHFYRPGGPYESFAGRDATRGLAQFDVTAVSTEWDDHADLTPGDWSSIQEWELQFTEKYHYVGKLVKELPKNDSADGSTSSVDSNSEKSKND